MRFDDPEYHETEYPDRDPYTYNASAGEKLIPRKSRTGRLIVWLSIIAMIGILLFSLAAFYVKSTMPHGNFTVSHSEQYSMNSCNSGKTSPGGNTARLPGSQLQETIADMKPGESEYTVPWAMEVFSDHTSYLQDSFAVTKDTEGTSDMEIQRTDTGYKVTLAPDFKYDISTSGDTCGLIPVEEIQP